MKNGEMFIVAFYGYKSRMFNGQIYYRLSFTIKGKEYSVKSATNEAGKAGKVMFVAKDSIGPDGNKAVNDCFSLQSITTTNLIGAATEACQALIDAKW